MSESFKPSQEKVLSPEAIYRRLPAANPRVLREGVDQGFEHFLFNPVVINVITDFLENENFLSETEKGLFKFSKETIDGEYEITCCSRKQSDTNRIDKMISGLDLNNPWEPAKLEHLILFRAIYPELLPSAAVVAFGTEQRGHMPRLEPDGKMIKHYRHGGFNSNLYYLIVRRK